MVTTAPDIEALLGKKPLEVWKPGDPLRTTVWGWESSGKTWLGLTWPDPLIGFLTEANLPEVLRSMPTKKITPFGPYRVPLLGGWADARKEADRFLTDYMKTLETLYKAGVRASILVDSGSDVWKLIRYAYVIYDDNGKAKPNAYEIANQKMQSIYESAKYMGHNLIVTAKADEQWGEIDRPSGGKQLGQTGADKAKWWSDSAYCSDLVIRIKTGPRATTDGKVPQRRMYEVRKATPNDKLVGQEFDSMDYGQLMGLIEAWG